MNTSVKTTASEGEINRRKTRSPYKWRASSQKLKDSLKETWKNRENNGYSSRPKPTEETKRKMSESHKRRWRKINDALKQMEEKEKEKEEATK